MVTSDTLLLDFDNTIVDYYQNEKNALLDIFTSFELDTKFHHEALKYYRDVNNHLWKKFEQNKIDLESIRYERFSKLMNKFDLSGDPMELNHNYIKNFVSMVELFPNTYSSLKSIKRELPDHNIIIVTNGDDEIQRKRINNLGIGHLFDSIITSNGIGVAKPSKRIFDAAIDIADSTYDRTWMIGDSLSSDIKGSIELGINNCLVGDRLDGSEVVKPDMTATRLTEFIKYYLSIQNGYN